MSRILALLLIAAGLVFGQPAAPSNLRATVTQHMAQWYYPGSGLGETSFTSGPTGTGWQPHNYLYGNDISIGAAGTAKKIAFRGNSGGGTNSFKIGLYDGSSNLLAQQTITGVTATAGWWEADISVAVSSGTHYVMVSCANTFGQYNYNTGDTGKYDTATYAASMPSSISTGDDAGYGYAVRVYVEESGGDDYTHSGTGALALSGSNSTVLDSIVISSGNLAVSGTTGVVLEAIVTTSGALTFTGSHAAALEAVVTSSGALLLTGTNSAILDAIAAVSGNLALSGSAAIAPDWVVSSSGGFLLGGTGEPVPGFDLVGTGALSLGGSVSVEFTESGDIVYSGSGNLALAGAASIVLDAITSQSGNLALGGSGAIAPDFLISGTGALSLAGSSALVPEFVLTSSGNLALSGSIATEANFVVAVSGDLELGGTAVVAYTGPVSTQVATSTIVVVPCVATVVKLDHRTVLLLQKPRTEVSLWKDIT